MEERHEAVHVNSADAHPAQAAPGQTPAAHCIDQYPYLNTARRGGQQGINDRMTGFVFAQHVSGQLK